MDVGSGHDPLEAYRGLWPGMVSVRSWDVGDGDAQRLAGVAEGVYDFVHSSHSLEHMADPLEALRNWVRVVRPGGYVVVVVPDEDMYEQGVWPSTFNADHRHSFTVAKRGSWSPASVNVTGLVEGVADVAECVSLLLLDATFVPGRGRSDRTQSVLGESAIEFVLRKRGV